MGQRLPGWVSFGGLVAEPARSSKIRISVSRSRPEIREVIYDLVQPPGHSGLGTGGWELVGSDGARLRVESSKQLAISSIQQQLRRAMGEDISNADSDPVGKSKTDASDGLDEGTSNTLTGRSGGKNVEAGGTGTSDVPKSTSYSWYRIEVTNRSITDEMNARPFARIYSGWPQRWMMIPSIASSSL